jgi:hypothetical protein
MTNAFFMLAVVGGCMALGGFAWSSALRPRSHKQDIRGALDTTRGTTSQSEDSAGAAEAADATPGGSTAEGDTRVSVAGVGRQVRNEGWRRALPGLLTAGGMLILLISAALALLTTLPSKVFGIAAVGIALYIAITELRSFRKALRD